MGNPSAHKIGLLTYFGKLARAIGSRNVFSASTLDQMPKQLASGLMFGHWLSTALPDITRTDLLLVIGANPLASNGSMWTVPDFKGKAKAQVSASFLNGQTVTVALPDITLRDLGKAKGGITPGELGLEVANAVEKRLLSSVNMGALAKSVGSALDKAGNAIKDIFK